MRIIKPAAGGFRHRRGGRRGGRLRRERCVPQISVEALAIDAVDLARDDVKEGRTISSGSAGRGGRSRLIWRISSAMPWRVGADTGLTMLIANPVLSTSVDHT